MRGDGNLLEFCHDRILQPFADQGFHVVDSVVLFTFEGADTVGELSQLRGSIVLRGHQYRSEDMEVLRCFTIVGPAVESLLDCSLCN